MLDGTMDHILSSSGRNLSVFQYGRPIRGKRELTLLAVRETSQCALD
jgi:hypothetical protein